MDKIPFCFPVFYHGLIARRTVYSQPEVVNLLLSGNMRAEPKWTDKVYAVPGECVRFRIGIRNMSSEMFRNLTLRDILPTGLSYINGSTMIYNAKHPQGVTLSDNIITDMGVNIGDYAPGANAWIYFDAATSKMTSSRNIIYRNVIQACGGYGEKEQSVDVLVDACET